MKKLFVILTVALLLVAFAIPVLATEPASETASVTEPASETVAATDAPSETEEETLAETEHKTGFGFRPESLRETVPIMGMGMLGIFLVIGVIVLVVLVLSAISNKLDAKDQD